MKVNLGKLTVTSPAFRHGERMPDDQSGNGAGVSPELSWSDGPEETRSFALIAHDPDAPLVRGFTHWVIYGIPGEARGCLKVPTPVSRPGCTAWAQPGSRPLRRRQDTVFTSITFISTR